MEEDDQWRVRWTTLLLEGPFQGHCYLASIRGKDDEEHVLTKTQLLTLWKIVMRIQSDLDKWEKTDPPKLDEVLQTEMNDLDQKNRQVGEEPWWLRLQSGQKHQPLQAGHNENDFPSVWAMFQYWPVAGPCDISLLLIPTLQMRAQKLGSWEY